MGTVLIFPSRELLYKQDVTSHMLITIIKIRTKQSAEWVIKSAQLGEKQITEKILQKLSFSLVLSEKQDFTKPRRNIANKGKNGSEDIEDFDDKFYHLSI